MKGNPAAGPVVYPADACPECHRKPGWHAPDCSLLTGHLDRDPDGTVAKARGLYLRAVGADPLDKSGRVAYLKEGAETVARVAEQRRAKKAHDELNAKWAALARQKPWPIPRPIRNIWNGLQIKFGGGPEVVIPELPYEVELTRGEWWDWVRNHRISGYESMVDHLDSIIPRTPGETYAERRASLEALRRSWGESDESRVNRAIASRRNPGGPPLRADTRSLGRSQPSRGPKARRTHGRPSHSRRLS